MNNIDREPWNSFLTLQWYIEEMTPKARVQIREREKRKEKEEEKER